MQITVCNFQELKCHRRLVADKVASIGSKHLGRTSAVLVYSRKKSYCCASKLNGRPEGKSEANSARMYTGVRDK